MVNRDEFVSFLLEGLEGIGSVRARAMFGGYGIYLNDLICAIIVESTLYVKADPISCKLFERRGLTRFSYLKKGKECFMSYYLVPEEAIDDTQQLNYWVQKGYEAALRAKKA